MASNYTPEQQDIITGARKEFKRELRRWGRYLVNGEWATTERIISGFDPGDPAQGYAGSAEEGTLEFTRLKNGNLKAELSMSHVVDKTPLVQEFIVALDPYRHTFTGIGGIRNGSSVANEWTASGSFDPKRGVLDWSDQGPGVGTLAGTALIRTWGFVDVC